MAGSRIVNRKSFAIAGCAVLLALFAASRISPARAIPATVTWVGGFGPNWSTAANWTGGPPANGDAVVFPAFNPNTSSTNDLTGLNLDSLTIAGAYNLAGQPLAITTAITVTAGAPVLGFISLSLAGSSVTLDVASGATATVNAPIQLGGFTLASSGGGIAVVKSIAGQGSLAVAGAGGEFHLDSSSASSINGTVSVSAGTLRVLPIAGNCAASGLSIAAGGLTVSQPGSLDVSCPITLQGTATLGGDGAIVLNAPGPALLLTGDGQSSFAGTISGSAGLSVTGYPTDPPSLVLSRTNTYSGPTAITGGIVALDHGAIAASPVSVSGGGAFGGQGTSGPLSIADAMLYPGITGFPAQLTTPGFSMAVQSVARFLLTGATAGSAYDQVVAAGPVVLNGATLNIRLGSYYDPPIGTAYTLISGATSLTGTFAGLPEGATFFVAGRVFTITYKAGTGNDVVITRQPALAADLSVTKTVSPTIASAGATVTFTITVANAGPNDARFPQLSDTLPPALLFQAMASPTGWTCTLPVAGTSGYISCQEASIAAGTSAVFTVTATIAQGASGTISNTAAVTSAASDNQTSNNSAETTIAVGSGLGYRRVVPMVASDG